MGVEVENSKWEPNPSLYGFIIMCCFFSIALFPRFFNKSVSPSAFSDQSLSPSSHRYFLFLYCLASGIRVHFFHFLLSFLHSIRFWFFFILQRWKEFGRFSEILSLFIMAWVRSRYSSPFVLDLDLLFFSLLFYLSSLIQCKSYLFIFSHGIYLFL